MGLQGHDSWHGRHAQQPNGRLQHFAGRSKRLSVLSAPANNAIAANKRPLSSMSPTIVLSNDGTPVLELWSGWRPEDHQRNFAKYRSVHRPKRTDRSGDRVGSNPSAMATGYCVPRTQPRWIAPAAERKPKCNQRRDRATHQTSAIRSRCELTCHCSRNTKDPRGLLAATDPRTDGQAIAL